MSPAVRAAFWLGVRKGIHAEATPRRPKCRKPAPKRAPAEFAPRAFTAAELELRAERMEANR